MKDSDSDYNSSEVDPDVSDSEYNDFDIDYKDAEELSETAEERYRENKRYRSAKHECRNYCKFYSKGYVQVLDHFRFNPNYIRFVENPSERLKEFVLKIDGYALEYIKNPSLELQLIAVRQHGGSIQFIENPSHEVQIEAVKQSGHAIAYIKNQTPLFIELALKYDPGTFRHFHVQEESHQLRAISHKPALFEYAKNPSEKVKNLALALDGRNISFVENPTKDDIATVFNDDYQNIWYLYNRNIELPDEIKFLAIEKDPFMIKYIKNPNYSLKCLAIKLNPSVIEFVPEPDLLLRQFALDCAEEQLKKKADDDVRRCTLMKPLIFRK